MFHCGYLYSYRRGGDKATIILSLYSRWYPYAYDVVYYYSINRRVCRSHMPIQSKSRRLKSCLTFAV